MLEVVGLGYPRTGTMSLKHGLEQLGLGPCYHMIEVFRRPEDVHFWRSALESGGRDVVWDRVFEGFRSTTDCPACHFWPELRDRYPNAKFILTLRDADDWYDSFKATVYDAMTHPERSPDDDHLQVQRMAKELILDQMFEGRFEDRPFAIDKYQSHNQRVQDAFSEEQLLVLNISEGWPRLCRFLNVNVPNSEFPKSNTRTEFQERFIARP